MQAAVVRLTGGPAAEASRVAYWVSGGGCEKRSLFFKKIFFCAFSWFFRSSQSTSEIFDGDSFLEGPSLPRDLAGHCAVEVEPGRVFLTDGVNGAVN